MAVTERSPHAPLRVTDRSLIARDRRHRERLGPGGEDSVICARQAARPFVRRMIGQRTHYCEQYVEQMEMLSFPARRSLLLSIARK